MPFTPGGGTTAGGGLLAQAWQSNLEDAVYDLEVFIPRIRDLQRPLAQLTIRKQARFSSATMGTSDTGLLLTYNATNLAPVTMVPAQVYVAANWNEDFDAQAEFSPESEFRQNAEEALAEGKDQTALAATTSFTTNVKGSYATDITAATWRDALASGRISGRSRFAQGKMPIAVVVHPAQTDDMGAIPEFAQAHLRGQGDSVMRSGLFAQLYGVDVYFSNVVSGSGGGANNPMFVLSTFGIAYNRRDNVKYQEIEYQHRVIVGANFATGLIHDLRGVNLRSKNV
jgi:hypothetical protein